MKIINCFGDSLTFGARDQYGLSYPSYLQHILDRKKFKLDNKNIIIKNSGINGNTSSDLLRRLSNEFYFNNDNFLLIILVGSNDAAKKIPNNIYENNLNSIIKLSKNFYENVLICEIPFMKGIGLTTYHNKSNNYIKSYNSIISKISKIYNIDKIKFDKNLSKYIIDTVHYNNKGYQLIANNIFEFIKSKYI